jgi:rRNA-processing protein FCF1
MEKTIQLLLAVTTLTVLAEVTYLVVKLPRQNISKKQGRPILVDTSVLIDGRIIAVAKSGFIGDTLVIPRSVIGELQYLADNADHEKRARARYGLDVVSDLQKMPQVMVEILQDGSKAEEGVDERLLNLAKKYSAAVCTIDYNLNKVAVVEGITVLNVNELAQSLRMAYLPGEKMLLELVQKGQDSHQGVGYLTDGTMVVVENASKQVGQTIEVEFIRSLQTAAGKMMFAKPINRIEQTKPVVKPQGKKLVQKTAPQPVHQPRQEVKQAPVVKAAVPTAYHSEHDKRNSQPRTGKQKQQVRPQPQQNTRPPRPQQQRQQPKKQRTSADREASLLELVDKQ